MRYALVTAAVVGCSSPAEVPVTPDASSDGRTVDHRPDAAMVVDDPCFPEPAAGHRVYECNGITFDIEVPASCVGGGCGVILDVHGLTMSGPMEEANSELRARGGAAGFVVIQPSANPSPPQSSWDDSDEPKVFDILTRAVAVYAVDPDRVHMTGFSQGGFMTWHFLRDHADVLASVAPAAACTTASDVPGHAVSVLYMHGSADDNYVPFSCAQPGVDAIASAWSLTSAGVVASSPTYSRTRYTDGGGTVVEFLVHDYTSDAQVPFVSASKLEGHCFPGSTDPGTQPGQLFPFGCEQPSSFVWGEEIVAFFLAHPR